jgi:hypothetical protein
MSDYASQNKIKVAHTSTNAKQMRFKEFNGLTTEEATEQRRSYEKTYGIRK